MLCEVGEKGGFVRLSSFAFPWELDKKVFEAQIYCMLINFLELFRGDRPIHIFFLVMPDGRVLGHEAQGQARPELKVKGCQDVDRVFYISV
jgi:hypothetical protein